MIGRRLHLRGSLAPLLVAAAAMLSFAATRPPSRGDRQPVDDAARARPRPLPSGDADRDGFRRPTMRSWRLPPAMPPWWCSIPPTGIGRRRSIGFSRGSRRAAAHRGSGSPRHSAARARRFQRRCGRGAGTRVTGSPTCMSTRGPTAASTCSTGSSTPTTAASCLITMLTGSMSPSTSTSSAIRAS